MRRSACASVVVDVDAASASQATGARSFRVLFGPHNGSTRATLFVGYLPPGPGAVALPPLRRDRVGSEGPRPRAASRLRRRARGGHGVPPASSRSAHRRELEPDRELTVLGIFTPAGSPAAAYLAPEP